MSALTALLRCLLVALSLLAMPAWGAVSGTVPSVQYVGAGSTGPFTVPFPFVLPSDLLVQTTDLSGNVATLVYGRDYSVTGGAIVNSTIPQTGQLTLTVALTSGYGLYIDRGNMPVTQPVVFPNQGPFQAQVVAGALDRGTLLTQQYLGRASRFLSVPLTDPAPTSQPFLPAITSRASQLAGWDVNGNFIPYTTPITTTNLPVLGIVQVLDTVALLKGVAVPSSAITYQVRGYYAAGDGGGGLYRWNSADTRTDNGGSILQLTVGGNGRWNLVVTGSIDVRQFGAYGDDTHDDTTAFSNELAAIATSGVRTVVQIGPGTYKISSGLVDDMNYVSINALRAKLDAATMSSGALLTVKSSFGGNPWNQGDTALRGLEMVGPGLGSSVDGLYYNDGTSGAAHLLVQSMNVHNFRYGLNIGNNSYAVSHVQCGFWSCARGIWMEPGLTNAGERLTFFGCDVFNNTLGIKQDFGSGEMFIENSSIDYNTKQIEVTGGEVICTDCHIESDPAAHTAPPFTCNTSGVSGLLRFAGCRFVYRSNAGNTGFTSMFDTDNLTGGVVVENCWYDIGGTVLPATWIAKKTGAGRYVETSYATNPSTNVLWWPTATSGENLMNDPGFEGAAFPQDLIQIEGDTAAITSRITGTNITLTQSASQFHGGSKSLKMQKGAGFNARFAILVPIRNKARTFGSIWYTKPGTGAGSFIIGVGYLNMLAMGNAITSPLTYSETDTGSTTVTITGTTAIGWTQQFLNFPVAPANATHAYIFVNANSFTGSDALYFDDLVMTEN